MPALVVVALMTASCGAIQPPPSPFVMTSSPGSSPATAAPTPSPGLATSSPTFVSPVPTERAVATSSGSAPTPDAPPPIFLPEGAVTTVEKPVGEIGSVLTNWGSQVWFTTYQHTLHQVDLLSGDDAVVERGYGWFGGADTNGTDFVWAEHSQNATAEVFVDDIATRQTRVLDSTVNGRHGYLAQVPELLDVDGDRVASQPASGASRRSTGREHHRPPDLDW